MILLQQLIALFAFMIIGLVIRRRGILDDSGVKSISWIVTYLGQPCLGLSAAISMEEALSPAVLGDVLLAAVFMYAAMILLSYPIAVLTCRKKEERCLYHVMSAFSNTGFMGIPLVSAMYGAQGVVYAAIFGIPHMLLLYTYGFHNVSQEARAEKLSLRTLVNVGSLSGILTLIIALVHPDLPLFVESIVENLGNLAVALGMFVVGASLAFVNVKVYFTDTRLLVYCLLRQVAVPLIVTFAAMQVIQDGMLIGVFVIMIATPIAAIVSMMAQQKNGNAVLCARATAVTTLMSVVTIPLVFLLLGIG